MTGAGTPGTASIVRTITAGQTVFKGKARNPSVLPLLRRLLHRCGRIHDLHDPLQVIDGGELDDDLPLTLPQFHLDPGLEQVGEAISQVTETGCGRRLDAGACRAAWRGIGQKFGRGASTQHRLFSRNPSQAVC